MSSLLFDSYPDYVHSHFCDFCLKTHKPVKWPLSRNHLTRLVKHFRLKTCDTQNRQTSVTEVNPAHRNEECGIV